MASCRRALSRLVRRISSKISSCLYSTDIGLEHFKDKIEFAGPVTVADYMRECLIHPSFGYYIQKDVFGRKGDFITSPEVSQVFGELLAVWVLSDWMTRGQPSNCQLVELGPGRGTLLKDILRVFSNKNLSSILRDGLSLHLVEASPALSAIQERTLQGVDVNPPTTADTLSSAIPYKTCTLNSHHGIQASWYQRLQDVPRGHSYFIAHEFFDALPIHQFQRTAKGWREVLVDIDPEKAPEKALRFVLAPGQTPASAAYTSLLPQATTHDRGSEGEWCEVCPEGLVLAKELASRVMKDGGAALIADYGEETIKKNTLRGFKQHALHDVLESPGDADLTADVDFGAIKRAVLAEGAGCFGPMRQNEFLHRMGIRQRIEMLMKGASSSQAQDLVSSYEVLTSPEKMGQRFKFLSVTSNPQHVPTPFNEPNT